MLKSADIAFTPNLPPEACLWLACLEVAVENLRDQRFGNDTPACRAAQEFLFDEHPGFEGLCGALGYEPDAMRRRVKKALDSSNV